MANNFNSAAHCIGVYNGESVTAGGNIVASASSEFSADYAAWKAFNYGSGYWATAAGSAAPSWLAYSFGSGDEHVVASYSIQGPSGTQLDGAPKNWTFDGYDGSSWTVLDTQTNQTGWTADQVRTFNFSNSTAYQAYRISISTNNGRSTCIISELTLMSGDGIQLSFTMAGNTMPKGTTPDSQGSTPLTVIGNSTLPSIDTVNYKQGAGSLDIDYLSAHRSFTSDWKLPSSWPHKLGTTNYSFSYVFWFKQSVDWSIDLYLVSKGGTTQGDHWLQLGSTRALTFLIEFAGGNQTIVKTGLTPGRWYLVAATFSSATGIARLYIYDDSTATEIANLTQDWSSYGNPTIRGGDLIVARALDGLVDELTVWDRALNLDRIRDIRDGEFVAALPSKAINPSPADDAAGISVTADLSWQDGGGADSFDVYFGTTPGALTKVSSDQAGTTYDPGVLESGVTYYWRIDTINESGTTTGDEWSFTTGAQPNMWLGLNF